MSYKKTNRTTIKGEVVRGADGSISIEVGTEPTTIDLKNILEDYLDKTVRITIAYDEEQI